jgi:hypothetical protein
MRYSRKASLWVSRLGLSLDEQSPDVIPKANLKPIEEEEVETHGESSIATAEFFQQPIFLQLPQMPNSTIASALNPGHGWAPSLPHFSSLKFSRDEIKDMMLRAKCGVKAGDTQKEAHLLFYLGVVYENKKNYKKVAAGVNLVHQVLQDLLQFRPKARG